MTDKPKRKPFSEAVYSAFYDCFRVSGFTPSIPQLERMQQTTKKMATILEAESKLVAIELINRVQEHLKGAFTDLGSQVDKIQEKLDNTEKRLTMVQNQVDVLRRTQGTPKKQPKVQQPLTDNKTDQFNG
jgi:hypothetical protein